VDTETENLQSLRAIHWLLWPADRSQDLLIASDPASSAPGEGVHVVVSVALPR